MQIKRHYLYGLGFIIALITVLYILLVHNGGIKSQKYISSLKDNLIILSHNSTIYSSSSNDHTIPNKVTTLHHEGEQNDDINHKNSAKGNNPSQTPSRAPSTNPPTTIQPITPSSSSSSSTTIRKSCTINESINLTLDKQRHIIIIGAMSFIGSRLAMYFHERDYHVLAVEDLSCIDNDDLKWYRWSELQKARIPIQVVMLSRRDKLRSLLSSHSPQAIIYVPTKAEGMDRVDDETSSVLRNYISLLMSLREGGEGGREGGGSGGPKFVLVSHSKMAKPWLTLYESLLFSLCSRKRSAIVRVTNVQGPWQDSPPTIISNTIKWYIDDVGTVVHRALTTSNQFLWNMDTCNSFITKGGQDSIVTASQETNTNTIKWENEYKEYRTNGKTRNVTLGAYLVNLSPNSFYGIFPVSNKFKYFSRWFNTAKSHGLGVVLFHDTMSTEFQKRLKEVYPKTDTVHVSPVNRIVVNDQRFYFIYDYLLKHDDINMAITTDIRDVEFLRNPAQIMSLLGKSNIYAGLDIPYFLTLGEHGQTNNFKKCFPSYHTKEIFGTYRFFNNGVLGGTRSMLLSLLIHMLSHLDVAIHYGSWCCDMSIVQLLLHTKFAEEVFVGYPFQSGFFTQTPGPRGLTVRHKPEYQ